MAQMDNYAIIALGGKQYVVKEGETILVDRLDREEGKTFQPDVLFLGGDGDGELAPTTNVSAKVLGHERGPKVRIGKYKPKSGYKRHTGFRSSLTRIEITGIGAKTKTQPKAAKADKPAKAEKAPETPKVEKAPEAPKAEVPAGLPDGYADMTVAQIHDEAKTWEAPALEAAHAYEEEHAKRKGALAALDSALKAKDENDGA